MLCKNCNYENGDKDHFCANCGTFLENPTVNEPPPEPKSYNMKFFGLGSEYFSIIIVNWLLTIITLGIYYPWARARKLQYIYGSTAFADDRFAFNGTGKEMFRGFVKVILFYAVFMGLIAAWSFYIQSNPTPNVWFGIGFIFVIYAGIFAIVPLMIHGAYRYRMSRTAWRGIRFGYRGTKKKLYGEYFKGFLLTLFTFGIYSPWFQIDVRKYITGNIRCGDVNFSYKGEGAGLFIIYLKYYLFGIAAFIGMIILFAIVALIAASTGLDWENLFDVESSFFPFLIMLIYAFLLIPMIIYYCWFEKNTFNYYIDNIVLEKDEKRLTMKSSATGFGIFKLRVVNLFLTVFTLGFGYAWVEMRTRKYFTESITISGLIDIDNISQTEELYTNAMFEDATDFFDIDIF
ncbi:MAG: DUF898 family protein [Prevotellaceae bacterium]|jgi:uncharacterized membrane protein YjgN (DUF898 family)|nr:DUF898 family protein [Prevotellaceae bacterium]